MPRGQTLITVIDGIQVPLVIPTLCHKHPHGLLSTTSQQLIHVKDWANRIQRIYRFDFTNLIEGEDVYVY